MANLGFEAKLWLIADMLRKTMYAEEFNFVVPGFIFPKFLPDWLDANHAHNL